jgi:hypothetical protein
MTNMEEQTNINRSARTTLVILSCLGLITMYGETMVLPVSKALASPEGENNKNEETAS